MLQEDSLEHDEGATERVEGRNGGALQRETRKQNVKAKRTARRTTLTTGGRS